MAKETKRIKRRMDKALDEAKVSTDKLEAAITMLKARIVAKLKHG